MNAGGTRGWVLADEKTTSGLAFCCSDGEILGTNMGTYGHETRDPPYPIDLK